MNVLLIFTTMFLLMFLGTDIFVSMGIAAVAYLLVTGNAPLTLISPAAFTVPTVNVTLSPT